ncbi:hypothetical protein NDU88_000716 [Pleurodeles waltl]|uniref:Uncharacterized protein n=1 Tax=Pleurodeles waltl TaxID=8319 RepID=A0AAV7UT53_PLEWA|nr:hypothetical protein NDU88_000716 [Pleurodeles waltl]
MQLGRRDPGAAQPGTGTLVPPDDALALRGIVCPTGEKEESCKPGGMAPGGPRAQCRRPCDRVCCACVMRLGRGDLKAARPFLVVLGPPLCCGSQAQFAAAPSGPLYGAPAPAFSPPHPRSECGGRRVRPHSWPRGLYGRLSAR